MNNILGNENTRVEDAPGWVQLLHPTNNEGVGASIHRLPLAVDATQTSNAEYGSSMNGAINDDFYYSPSNPAGGDQPLLGFGQQPDQAFSTSGSNYAITFEGLHTGLIVDLWGRKDLGGESSRDNDLTLTLYDGNWSNPVATINNVSIPNVGAAHKRIILDDGVIADRLKIKNQTSTVWTIQELRVAAITDRETYTLDWKDASGADSYKVYLWTSGGRPSSPTHTTNLSYWTPSNLQGNTTYKWQVEAINAQGSSWSPEWIFNTGFPDSDNDRIRDVWELQHFGAISLQNSSTDADGDGILDVYESYLGLNPNDASEFFSVSIEKDVTGKVLLRWPSRDGVTYRILSNPELDPNINNWQSIIVKDTDGDLTGDFGMNAPNQHQYIRTFYKLQILSKD